MLTLVSKMNMSSLMAANSDLFISVEVQNRYPTFETTELQNRYPTLRLHPTIH